MSARNPIALNKAVLDALGIDYKGRHITRVTITCDGPSNLPSATITQYLTKPLPGGRFTWEADKSVTHLKLVAAAPASFDIDAACDAARAAVAATIERATRRAHTATHKAFFLAKLEAEIQSTKTPTPRPTEAKTFEKQNFDLLFSYSGTLLSRLTGLATGIALGLALGLAILGLRRSA